MPDGRLSYFADVASESDLGVDVVAEVKGIRPDISLRLCFKKTIGIKHRWFSRASDHVYVGVHDYVHVVVHVGWRD